MKGHCVESEERSVLHVVRLDGRHAAGQFCSYDEVEAEGLIRGYKNAGRGEKNEDKRKGKGSCGRGARRRGTCGGRAPRTCFIFHCRNTNLAIFVDSRNSRITPLAVRNLLENALYFSLILQAHQLLQNLKTIQQGMPMALAELWKPISKCVGWLCSALTPGSCLFRYVKRSKDV